MTNNYSKNTAKLTAECSLFRLHTDAFYTHTNTHTHTQTNILKPITTI